MASAAFQYWRPGEEERQLRVFCSHRYGGDEHLYKQVVADLNRNGFSVQDTSLSASELLRGPRGGRLSKMQVQAEIAARIYTSDVLIAPSRPAASRSDWVSWEVQLAAIGYGVPIVFVNQRADQQYNTRLVRQVAEMKLRHCVCNLDIKEISSSVAKMVDPRPRWGVRDEETGAEFRFRGPPSAALDRVFRRVPFQARLSGVDGPPPRKGFWSFLSSRAAGH